MPVTFDEVCDAFERMVADGSIDAFISDNGLLDGYKWELRVESGKSGISIADVYCKGDWPVAKVLPSGDYVFVDRPRDIVSCNDLSLAHTVIELSSVMNEQLQVELGMRGGTSVTGETVLGSSNVTPNACRDKASAWARASFKDLFSL